jgi:hypothetical protein
MFSNVLLHQLETLFIFRYRVSNTRGCRRLSYGVGGESGTGSKEEDNGGISKTHHYTLT